MDQSRQISSKGRKLIAAYDRLLIEAGFHEYNPTLSRAHKFEGN